MNNEEKIAILKIVMLFACLFLIVEVATLYYYNFSPHCYLEYGKITEEHGGNDYYHVRFINRNGTRRHIWLSDAPPENLNYIKAMMEYDAELDENVVFRWCFVPSIGQYRIRGAWKW